MKYYGINEEIARRAKESYSFSDYKLNSTTSEYCSSVNEVYEIAEKQKLKVDPKHHEKIDMLVERYSRKLAAWTNKKNSIDASCPSVMITGPSNFPFRKKEKQLERLHTHYQSYDNIRNIIAQIQKIGTSAEIIKSSDENVLGILQDKINKLQLKQDYMKKVNSYYRKYKTCKGCDGVNDDMAKELDDSMKKELTWGTAPFPSFTLTNNNACIKNTKQRLEKLTQAKAVPTAEREEQSNPYFTVIENTEIMRLQLIFEGKPSIEIRNILKRNGYKWSPNNTAWQRQLTTNARNSVKYVLTDITKLTA